MEIAALTCLNIQRSVDGSRKFLWQLPDRQTLVESIAFTFPDQGQDRPFLCLSSQDGCNVGCAFCATGKTRMRNNLTASEMVAQVVKSLEHIQAARVFHVAFAGMGEPLLNYEQVMQAAAYLRRQSLAEVVSVSTAGVVPRIYDLAGVAAISVNRLYISLHATTDAQRNQLVPLNTKYSLAQVLEAARDYAQRTQTKVTATYLVFAGLNDTDEDLDRLQHLLDPERFVIQLSVWNQVEGFSFVPSPRTAHFHETLTSNGYETFLQQSKGRDIEGGCGQLRVRMLPIQQGTQR